MHYTNKLKLDRPLVNILTFDPYTLVGDISATGLIKPPRITQLEKRHDSEIVKDVIDNFYSMLGQATHLLLAQTNDEDEFHEETLTCEVNGWTVSGTTDRMKDKVQDYKSTSVWTYIYGGRDEWVPQLNIYGYMWQQAGFEVKSLEVIALFRDWMETNAVRISGYPQQPVLYIPIPMWTDDKCIAYLKERITSHQEAENLADNDLPLCTPQERWERPTTWAVMKEGRKTALRVFDNQDQAYDYKDIQPKNSKTYVVERPGESPRCERYCDVKGFCNQYQEMKKEA